MRAADGILSPAGMRTQAPPVSTDQWVIGAAQPLSDDLAERKIGAKMRTPSLLHHRFTSGIAPHRDLGAEERPADQRTGRQLARQTHRVPGAVIARLWALLLHRHPALGGHDAHGILPAVWYHPVPFLKIWYCQGTESRDPVPKTSVTRPSAPKKTKSGSALLDDLPPKRRAILAAAYDVLMEQGYARAGTLEIATRARVSKRELYAEFGSKRGILEALVAAGGGTDAGAADRCGPGRSRRAGGCPRGATASRP